MALGAKPAFSFHQQYRIGGATPSSIERVLFLEDLASKQNKVENWSGNTLSAISDSPNSAFFNLLFEPGVVGTEALAEDSSSVVLRALSSPRSKWLLQELAWGADEQDSGGTDGLEPRAKFSPAGSYRRG